MSKRWWMVAGALLGLCATAPLALAAGETQVLIKLGSSVPTSDYKTAANSGAMAGLELDYRWRRRIALGAEGAYYQNASTRDGNLVTVLDPNVGKDVTFTIAESFTLIQMGAYAKYYLHEGKWLNPFVRAGVGVYGISYTFDARSASATTTAGGKLKDTYSGLNGGFGTAIRIMPQTTLGIEGLYHQVFLANTDVTFYTVGVTLGFGPAGK